jgi:hypothetical protein
VAVPVLTAAYPDRPPYRLIEVPREHPPTEAEPRPHGRRASDREPVAARVGDTAGKDDGR